jgi:hypothetical protein
MEGWDGQANWNRDVLERIVALLFALASLADLAAGAPFLRRRQVLAILSYGEAEARAFVIGVAIGAPAPADTLESTGDAERLAASFRALALLLSALLARSRQSARPVATGLRGCRPPRMLPGPMVHWPDARAPPALEAR